MQIVNLNLDLVSMNQMDKDIKSKENSGGLGPVGGIDLGRALRLWLNLQNALNGLYDTASTEGNIGGGQVILFHIFLMPKYALKIMLDSFLKSTITKGLLWRLELNDLNHFGFLKLYCMLSLTRMNHLGLANFNLRRIWICFTLKPCRLKPSVLLHHNFGHL